jgi:Tfp pilus assembly protein PilO
MIEKILERLPYDLLERVKFAHLLLGSAAVGLLLFSVYFFTLYKVNHEELAQLQTKRTQMEQKLNNYKKLVAQKDSIANDLTRSRGKLDAMKQQLPKAEDMPGLLKEVASFGGGRGAFEVTHFQLEQGGVKDFYKKIPVAIQMRGSFWDTLDFLDKMQNRLQLVNVSDLKMSLQENRAAGRSEDSEGGSNGSNFKLNTKLVANTYAYIEGAEDKVAAVPGNVDKKTK